MWGTASQGRNSALGARAEPVLEVLAFCYCRAHVATFAPSAVPGQLFRDAIPQSVAGEQL